MYIYIYVNYNLYILLMPRRQTICLRQNSKPVDYWQPVKVVFLKKFLYFLFSVRCSGN